MPLSSKSVIPTKISQTKAIYESKFDKQARTLQRNMEGPLARLASTYNNKEIEPLIPDLETWTKAAVAAQHSRKDAKRIRSTFQTPTTASTSRQKKKSNNKPIVKVEMASLKATFDELFPYEDYKLHFQRLLDDYLYHPPDLDDPHSYAQWIPKTSSTL
jgi:hypothetical protein